MLRDRKFFLKTLIKFEGMFSFTMALNVGTGLGRGLIMMGWYLVGIGILQKKVALDFIL